MKYITTERSNYSSLVIHLHGMVSTNTASSIQKEIEEELFDEMTSLTIDMEDVSYISSMGLRLLLALKKQSIKDRFSIEIVNISDMVMEIFRTTGFDEILL